MHTTAPKSAPTILTVLDAWADAAPEARDAQSAAARNRLKAARPVELVATVAKSDADFAVDPLAHDAAIDAAGKACARTLRRALADRVRADAQRAGEALAARMLATR